MRKVLTRFHEIWAVSHASPKRRLSETTKAMQRKLKVATGKHITIAQLATSLNRSPRECRAALRTLAIKKPPQGWSWPPSEAAIIKSRLTKKFSGKQSPKNSEGVSRRVPKLPQHIPANNENTSAPVTNTALDEAG